MNTLISDSTLTIIEKFQLEPHIEGGFFREDFRSQTMLPADVTGVGNRSLLTTCYYLIPQGERSIFHKLVFDEVWNFIHGGAVDFYEIDASGNLTHIILGPDIHNDQKPKHVLKKGTWVGVIPHKDVEHSFFSVTVFPGFEYNDWEKGDREFLKNLCPNASDIIDLLT